MTINQLFLRSSRGNGVPQEKLLILGKVRMEWHYLIERILLQGQDQHTVALENIRRMLPDASEEVLRSFKAENQEGRSLERHLKLSVDYVLGSFEEIDLNRIDDRYPGAIGLVTLSDIGFNRDRSEALLHAGILTSCRSGFGCVVLLRRHQGIWQIKKQHHVWTA